MLSYIISPVYFPLDPLSSIQFPLVKFPSASVSFSLLQVSSVAFISIQLWLD
jgi:hypothetical protein